MNKASGGDGIPAELFKILKDGAVKVPCSISQQIWKTQQWPQDWKRSVLIPIPKKVKGESRSVMSTSATLWVVTHQAPLSMEVSSQEYWRGCHSLLQGLFPTEGSNPGLKGNAKMAPHSSTLAWKIPWTEEPGRLQSMGSLQVGHDWATSLSLFTFMHWRRKWQPTPVFLPGEFQGRGSPVGCCLWGRTELDTTEVT